VTNAGHICRIVLASVFMLAFSVLAIGSPCGFGPQYFLVKYVSGEYRYAPDLRLKIVLTWHAVCLLG
jgi:hypothetical protein